MTMPCEKTGNYRALGRRKLYLIDVLMFCDLNFDSCMLCSCLSSTVTLGIMGGDLLSLFWYDTTFVESQNCLKLNKEKSAVEMFKNLKVCHCYNV